MIPPYLQKTEFGPYTAFVQHPAVLVLVCTGKQIGQYSTNPVQVTLIVTPENIDVTIND